MIQKTQAIALHTVRFGDSSLIAYLYSLDFGRITLMVNKAFARTGGKAAFFQPLSLISTVFYPARNYGMGRLKEVSINCHTVEVYSNPVKRAIALFIGEVIYRSVREEESNPQLFQFLDYSIRALDAIEVGVANFHLLFLSQLSTHLGFFPHGNFSALTPYFDYKNGVFVKSEPTHPLFFSKLNSSVLSQSLGLPYDQAASLTLNGEQRASFLAAMLSFYSFHTESVQHVKSLNILSQVFDE